jgi:hypothetical protein
MIEVRYIENDHSFGLDAIVSIDGVDTHDGHVIALKEDLYSFISDASKDAYGSRRRLNIHEYTVAELEELCDYYSAEAAAECERENAAQLEAEARFEKTIANLIESGAGDRETAVRWIRDAQEDHDRAYGDDYIKYSLGLSYSYDLDHGDRNYYERKAAAAA